MRTIIRAGHRNTQRVVDRRRQELDQRRHYMKNQWYVRTNQAHSCDQCLHSRYCVALSKNLKQDKPLGVEILGQKVVLFRDENGRACCMSDTCPHRYVAPSCTHHYPQKYPNASQTRGAPMSHGWVQRDVQGSGHTCVVCPYHGWAIDHNGVLQDVPAAEKKASWNTMVRLRDS